MLCIATYLICVPFEVLEMWPGVLANPGVEPSPDNPGAAGRLISVRNLSATIAAGRPEAAGEW